MMRPCLNDALAGRNLDGNVELRELRRKEQQVHRQSDFFVADVECDRRCWIDADLHGVQMPDVVFKVARRTLLIASVKEVNGDAVSRRDGVRDLGEFHHIHLFLRSPLLPPSCNLATVGLPQSGIERT